MTFEIHVLALWAFEIVATIIGFFIGRYVARNGLARERSEANMNCARLLARDSALKVRLTMIEALREENRVLRANAPKSVIRRLIMQKAIRPYGYCPVHGGSLHPEETDCPICGKALLHDR